MRHAPSLGTPGEGRGEGDLERKWSFVMPKNAFAKPECPYVRNHPHPNPLPEYRERGKPTAWGFK